MPDRMMLLTVVLQYDPANNTGRAVYIKVPSRVGIPISQQVYLSLEEMMSEGREALWDFYDRCRDAREGFACEEK